MTSQMVHRVQELTERSDVDLESMLSTVTDFTERSEVYGAALQIQEPTDFPERAWKSYLYAIGMFPGYYFSVQELVLMADVARIRLLVLTDVDGVCDIGGVSHAVDGDVVIVQLQANAKTLRGHFERAILHERLRPELPVPRGAPHSLYPLGESKESETFENATDDIQCGMCCDRPCAVIGSVLHANVRCPLRNQLHTSGSMPRKRLLTSGSSSVSGEADTDAESLSSASEPDSDASD